MKSSLKPKRVSIHEVAKRSGCSIATVSNVLNGKGRVGKQQHAAVLEAVEFLGYVTDRSGRNLRLGRTESVGLLFYPSCARLFRNVSYAEIMEGLEEEFTQNHYNLVLAGYQISELYAQSAQQILDGRVDALVLLGACPSDTIEQLSHNPKPLVLIDTDAPDLSIDSVVADGVSASKLVVTHLAELGHTRILMVAYARDDFNIDSRVRGFQQALHQLKLDAGPETVIREHQYNDEICDAVLERLAQPNAPTAVYAVNDTLAMALEVALTNRGYSVPEDVSLVGFDDDEFTGLKNTLTTIRVDRRELGKVGADIVFRRIKSPDAPIAKLRLNTELVVRTSTGPVSVK